MCESLVLPRFPAHAPSILVQERPIARDLPGRAQHARLWHEESTASFRTLDVSPRVVPHKYLTSILSDSIFVCLVFLVLLQFDHITYVSSLKPSGV